MHTPRDKTRQTASLGDKANACQLLFIYKVLVWKADLSLVHYGVCHGYGTDQLACGSEDLYIPYMTGAT